MPFKFKLLCELLDKLESRYPPSSPVPNCPPANLETHYKKELVLFFKTHVDRLNQYDTQSDAVKCMLRPESWVGRHFFWESEDLETLLSQVSNLTETEVVELHEWKKKYPCTTNPGIQVGRIWAMKQGPNQMVHPDDEVTVEEIDQFFIKTAAHNPRSSLELQSLARHCPNFDAHATLKDIFSRLYPSQAKWMTRLLLKTTDPVQVPASFVADSGSFKLPRCIPILFDLSSSPAPTTLMRGKTGRISVIKPIIPSPIPPSANTIARRRSPTPERRGSPETEFLPGRRGRQSARGRGLESMNRSVSKPRTTRFYRKVPLPTPPSSLPKPLDPASNVSEKSAPQSSTKRRRLSRDDFPVFKLGYLYATGSDATIEGAILTPPRSSPTPLDPAPNASEKSAPQVAAKRRRLSRDDFPVFKVGYLGSTETAQGTILTPSSSLLKPLGPAPNMYISENSESTPVVERRRLSRKEETSVLQPMREANIVNNRSLSKTLANTPAPRDSLPQSQKNRPSIPLANYSQPRLPPTTENPSNDSQNHQTVSKVSSPSTIPDDTMPPYLSPTPSSATLASHSSHENMDAATQTTRPSTEELGLLVQPSSIPNPSIENPQAPSPIVRSPSPDLQILSSTVPNSPLIIGGTGLCTLPNASPHCPLRAIIFLPSPYLPATIIERLKTELFPLHGARYVNNINDLGDPSLPVGCRATRSNYRRIILVEPNDGEATERAKTEVRDLGVKGKNGKRFPMEFFDWRLLETFSAREWSRDVNNPWNVYFVTIR